MVEYIQNDIITADSRDVKFKRVTDKQCPSCGHGENPNMLYVRSCIEMTVELECKNCGYGEVRPQNEFPDISPTMPEALGLDDDWLRAYAS